MVSSRKYQILWLYGQYFVHFSRNRDMKKELIIIFFLLVSLILTGQQPSQELGPMPDIVFETSGLIFYNGKLVTHNDSGGTPQLFEIDTVSLQITRTITLTNVENVDWEDIAQDDLYIYIGDFGNNVGTRQDLAIYRVAKADYDSSDSVTAEVINFEYEDQADFTNVGNSDWDAEALFVLNDQLIVLTKQWQTEGTIAYSLPKVPGNYMATKLDSYNTNGLVTGATYNPTTESLHIIGYNRFLQPFIFRVEGASGNAIFEGTVSRSNFEIGQAQAESIAYADSNTYFFSTEVFTSANPPINLDSLLFSFKPEETVEEEEEAEEEDNEPENPEDEESELILFRPFGSIYLNYRLNTESKVLDTSIFDTSGRLISNFSYGDIEDNRIDISNLEGAVYYLTFYTSKGLISKPFSGR